MTEKRIGRELRCLSNLIMRDIDNSSIKKSLDKITGTNGWIIGYIAENSDRDVFQKDLEKEFGITRSTASRVVELMVHKGLIERQKVDYDARLKKLTLTPKAAQVFQMMDKDNRRMEQKLMRGFSDYETELLMSYLLRMQENMREKDSDDCCGGNDYD